MRYSSRTCTHTPTNIRTGNRYLICDMRMCIYSGMPLVILFTILKELTLSSAMAIYQVTYTNISSTYSYHQHRTHYRASYVCACVVAGKNISSVSPIQSYCHMLYVEYRSRILFLCSLLHMSDHLLLLSCLLVVITLVWTHVYAWFCFDHIGVV